jgi:hypothetical protein
LEQILKRPLDLAGNRRGGDPAGLQHPAESAPGGPGQRVGPHLGGSVLGILRRDKGRCGDLFSPTRHSSTYRDRRPGASPSRG